MIKYSRAVRPSVVWATENVGPANEGPRKRRTKIQGWKMQDLENGGPSRRAKQLMCIGTFFSFLVVQMQRPIVAACLSLLRLAYMGVRTKFPQLTPGQNPPS